MCYNTPGLRLSEQIPTDHFILSPYASSIKGLWWSKMIFDILIKSGSLGQVVFQEIYIWVMLLIKKR